MAGLDRTLNVYVYILSYNGTAGDFMFIRITCTDNIIT